MCGQYKWDGKPFQKTGKKSNKHFSVVLGHKANGKEEVDFNLSFRQKMREAHTMDGVINNLYSVPKLV